MARVRRGGANTGWPAAAAFLGVAFIVAVVLAVVFAVQAGNAADQVAELERTSSTYVSAADRADARLNSLREQVERDDPSLRGQTTMALLLRQNQMLKDAIGVAEVADLRRRQETLAIEGETLLAAIDRLHSERQALTEQLQGAQDQLARLNQRIEQFGADQQQLAAQYQEERQRLQQGVEEARLSLQVAEADKRRQMDAVEQRLQQVRGELAEQTRTLNELRAQRDQQLTGMRERMEDLEGQLQRRGGPQVTTLAEDGRIISIEQDRAVVYIDLTRNDQIRPGMTFEVIDQNRVIDPEAFTQLRGKATLEVVNVGAAGSTARIVRQERNASINVGDKIINVAFNPGGINEFFVFGEFDLSNVGEVSRADAETIKAMIRRAGGRVADDLSYQTDYVVLGAQPPQPRQPPEDAPLSEWEAFTFARNKFEEFEAVKRQAQELRVPILNQNSFRTLYGVYTR